MTIDRGSGILLHISSLPGPHGIGDLGTEARHFIDFLAAGGQSYWQVLPLGPTSTSFYNSPYMSISTFAGNPLFISPESLVTDGLLTRNDLEATAGLPGQSGHSRAFPGVRDTSSVRSVVNYDAVISAKETLLRKAYAAFRHGGGSPDFTAFRSREGWLFDYTLFLAIKEEQDDRTWDKWPGPLARHEPDAVAAARERLAGVMDYHQFVQFLFHQQWQRLHDHARSQGIRIIGDIPIYVAFDSADVWANRSFFKISAKTLIPSHVAGVPPDYFSRTGQRWGNPLYRWRGQSEIRAGLFAWWRRRLEKIFTLTDIVRIDHFRGFEAFWAIPASEETAINGRWLKGPGKAFFQRLRRELGQLPIIAEDLGLITEAVHELRRCCGFPGMKVLQFAFDGGSDNSYLPHNYNDSNCVVYTGTHDNDTTRGWYHSSEVDDHAKERARRYARGDGSEIHWDFIRMALASTAKAAIIPAQDLLGCGSDSRMNLPSIPEGNWQWRCPPELLTDAGIRARLKEETAFYGRCGYP